MKNKKTWHKPSLSKLINAQTTGLGKQRSFPAAYENASGSHVVFTSTASHFTNRTRRPSYIEHWAPDQGSRITSNHLGFGPS